MMTSKHHHSDTNSSHSQRKRLYWIEIERRGRRWLKKLLMAIAIVLALAVALSYVFISKETAPDNLKVPEKGTHGIF